MMKNRLIEDRWTSLQGTGVLVTTKPMRRRTRRESFRDAWRGLCDVWHNESNLRLQIYIGVCVVALGMCLQLELMEWLWVSFAIGLVIFAELMNTAIEQTVDLAIGLSPDPLARRVKDLAAGFVLVACVIAVMIGGLTFGPHLVGG